MRNNTLRQKQPKPTISIFKLENYLNLSNATATAAEPIQTV